MIMHETVGPATQVATVTPGLGEDTKSTPRQEESRSFHDDIPLQDLRYALQIADVDFAVAVTTDASMPSTVDVAYVV